MFYVKALVTPRVRRGRIGGRRPFLSHALLDMRHCGCDVNSGNGNVRIRVVPPFYVLGFLVWCSAIPTSRFKTLATQRVKGGRGRERERRTDAEGERERDVEGERERDMGKGRGGGSMSEGAGA